MSSSSSNLSQRFRELPKQARWAAVAVTAIVAYIFLDDYSWSLAREWNAESDEIEILLAEGTSQSAPLPRSIESAVRSYGLLEVPASEAEGSHGLARAINDVVKKHRVGSFSYEARAATRLPSGALSGAVAEGQRVERVLGEVSFEVAPDDVAMVLADIENDPAVDAIGAIRMDWLDAPKKVSVRMTVEAWVVGSRSARRGA
ncbi:MAG: hypothetical protein EXS00_09365 [Phycisphaerales bacterium]|nr:hypothetical protein [Phycisphaerales bacterium]